LFAFPPGILGLSDFQEAKSDFWRPQLIDFVPARESKSDFSETLDKPFSTTTSVKRRFVVAPTLSSED